MIHSEKHQKGLTFISLVFILVVIAFFVLLLLKIGPIYMNHSKVINALSAVENTVDIQTKSKFEIQQSFRKRFSLNYVEYISPEDVKVIKRNNYLKVEIEYERVVAIVGNLSVLVEFYDSFEIGGDE